MNECAEQKIKDLLPSYAEKGDSLPEAERIAKHLAFCGDCRTELALLRSLTVEPVPDPGDAFWRSLQDRVYREVRAEQEKQPSPFLVGLRDLFSPRWAWAASTALVLLVTGVLFFRPVQHQQAKIAAPIDDQPAYGAQYAADTDDLDVTGLGTDDLRTLSAWADHELSAMENGYAFVASAGSIGDLDEEVASLTEGQLKRLSKMLEAKKQEG